MREHIRYLKKNFPDLEIGNTRGNHMFVVIDGRKVYMSSTPSDRRSVLNIKSNIRKAQKRTLN